MTQPAIIAKLSVIRFLGRQRISLRTSVNDGMDLPEFDFPVFLPVFDAQ
jgi:hypothetical protein